MGRHFPLGLLVAVLSILGCVQCSINDLWQHEHIGSSALEVSPLKSDIAFAFFKEAQRLAVSNFSRDASSDLCQNHLERIYRGILDFQEWALECKNKFFFFGGVKAYLLYFCTK